MPKYILTETVIAHVTYEYEIEANDEDDAWDSFVEDAPDPIVTRVGDNYGECTCRTCTLIQETPYTLPPPGEVIAGTGFRKLV